MFDLLFLGVVGLSVLFAVLRGGLQELATLAALVIAAGLAWVIAPALINLFGLASSFFGSVIVAGASLGILFIAAHIGFYLALKHTTLTGNAKLYNKIGGGAFGLARGLILVGLGYLGYSYYLDESRQPDSVRSAVTRPLAETIAGMLENMAPASTELEGVNQPGPQQDASTDGYGRAERAGLDEIVTTVTTSGDEPNNASSIKTLLESEEL